MKATIEAAAAAAAAAPLTITGVAEIAASTLAKTAAADTVEKPAFAGDAGGGTAGTNGVGEHAVRCGLPSCSSGATKTCTGCGETQYCSRAHQRSHWKVHKVHCRGDKAKKGTMHTDPPEKTGLTEGAGVTRRRGAVETVVKGGERSAEEEVAWKAKLTMGEGAEETALMQTESISGKERNDHPAGGRVVGGLGAVAAQEGKEAGAGEGEQFCGFGNAARMVPRLTVCNGFPRIIYGSLFAPAEVTSELILPRLPGPGALSFLEGLNNKRFNMRQCIVIGPAPNGRLAVLCMPATVEQDSNGALDPHELPICVLPEKLRSLDCDDPDWYPYLFARGFPTLFETAALRTTRIVHALYTMELDVRKIQLVPIFPESGCQEIKCHDNVMRACQGRLGGEHVLGYSLVPAQQCLCLTIEQHSIVLRGGVHIDVTPDYDGLSAKFFVPEPEISFSEFNWLANQCRAELNVERDVSVAIAPAITSTGVSAIECGLACCRSFDGVRVRGEPISNPKGCVPRKQALEIIRKARKEKVDFSILY